MVSLCQGGYIFYRIYNLLGLCFLLLVGNVGNAYFIMKSCSFVNRFMMIATVDIREKL